MSDSTTTSPETVVRKHPIRGLLWGLMFGIGLTLVLVFTTVISLDLTTMIIVAAVGTVIGVLWGMFGPAKAPKGPAPAPHRDPEPPAVSRFDDFNRTVAPAPVPEAIDESLDQAVEAVETGETAAEATDDTP